jgi:hypothetical protein
LLRFVHIEEISELLIRLPNVVQLQERRSVEFLPSVGSWLSSLEDVLAASRHYQTGNIAMLRSSLVAAAQGDLPAGLQFRGRPTRSRIMGAVALKALQRAAEIASALITENQPRLGEAERIAQQIVAAARSRGMITPRVEGQSNTAYLQSLMGDFRSNVDLGPAVAHLSGLVGPYDALIFIDRALVSDVSST